MSQRIKNDGYIRIALVQLESNPSISVADVDYLCEPFIPQGALPLLSNLRRYPETNDIQQIQIKFRDRYLRWAGNRLRIAFGALEDMGDSRPDVVVFPEFSIPYEHLEIVADSVRRNGWTVVAGNHAYNRSIADYRADLEKLCSIEVEGDFDIPAEKEGAANSIVAVLGPGADISDKVVMNLRFKQVLSPFEFTDVHREVGHRQPMEQEMCKWVIPISNLDNVSMQVMVCAEALQGVSPRPESRISVVCAFHDKPQDFDRFLNQKALVQGIGVLASDGKFGGSRIAFNRDRRVPSWWQVPPFDGRLPKGDAILVHEFSRDQLVSPAGSANPQKPERLLAIAAIVSSDEREDQCLANKEFQEAVAYLASDFSRHRQFIFAKRLRLIISKYGKMTPTQKMKISVLMRMADAVQVNRSILSVLGKDYILISEEKGGNAAANNTDDQKFDALSLHGLRKQCAEDTHAWLRHKVEGGNLSKDTNSACIEAQAECRSFFREGSVLGPVPAFEHFLKDQRSRGLDKSIANLNYILGTLIENYSASSGWIFLADEGPQDELELHEVVSQNVALGSKRLHISLKSGSAEQNGICGYCCAQRRPLLVSDINSENASNYRMHTLPTTRSLLAAPIFTVGGGKIKGVIILESDDPFAFVEPQKDELLVDSTKILPELILLDAIRFKKVMMGWHPYVHGWNIHRIFEALSGAISTSLLENTEIQSLCCTIWIADWKKRYLYTRSTVRFNFEYISSRLLPVQWHDCGQVGLLGRFPLHAKNWIRNSTSFTGRVASKDEGVVEKGPISELRDYNRPEKASRMGLSYLISTPVYEPLNLFNGSVQNGASSDPPRLSSGVLSFYFFRRQPPQNEFSIAGAFSDFNVAWMGEIIGRSLFETIGLKERLAVSQIHSRISIKHIPGVNFIEIFRDEISKVIGCDAMAVFGAIVDQSNWEVLSVHLLDAKDLETTRDSISKSLALAVFHDDGFYRFHGITGFLARFPGATVRKVDVSDWYESGSVSLGDQLDSIQKWATGKVADASGIQECNVLLQPGNLLKEKSDTDLEHRRLLAASVALAEPENGVQRVAVIRLIRNSDSRPFTPECENLIRMYLEYARPLLMQELVGEEVRTAACKVDDALGFPDGWRWNRKFLLSMLQHVVSKANASFEEVGEQCEVLIGSLLFKYDHQDGMRYLRTYASDGIGAGRPTKIERGADRYLARGSVEDTILSQGGRCAIVFESSCIGDVDRGIDNASGGEAGFTRRFNFVDRVDYQSEDRRSPGLIVLQGKFLSNRNAVTLDALKESMQRVVEILVGKIFEFRQAWGGQVGISHAPEPHELRCNLERFNEKCDVSMCFKLDDESCADERLSCLYFVTGSEFQRDI